MCADDFIEFPQIAFIRSFWSEENFVPDFFSDAGET